MVCPMLMRMYAAGLAVIAAVSFTLVPNQAFGRAGGFGGRSLSIAPSFRSSAFQRPLGFRAPALHHSLFLHRHRSGFGAPLTGPPLLRRVGLYGSILPIFLCLSRRPLSRRCCC